MQDFIENVFGIITVIIIGVATGLFILTIGIALTPFIIFFMIIIGIIYIIDKVLNKIRAYIGKEEKHILNFEIERGDK